MNHFMLPRPPGNDNAAAPGVFGIHAMPMLLDAMIEAGRVLTRIRAKLFGGSRNVFGGRDISMMKPGSWQASFHDSGVRFALAASHARMRPISVLLPRRPQPHERAAGIKKGGERTSPPWKQTFRSSAAE